MSTSKTETQTDPMDNGREERLEDMLQDIEELIAHMEGDDISLDEAFEAYQQGMRKLRSCNEHIDRIEKQMLVLNEQGELEEF